MTSQVFYRKWRPQTLSDVVGQQQATVTLINALKSSRVSHAYLFCGPRGTGKTSTGRILAKAVNCLDSGSSEPCNECNMCLSITEGRAMDVIEIDAASNTGVDDIRALKERVNYAPGQAKYKVYIIDEVHMLSNSASNALLKTLEEPPPNVIFILATTEAHKVLPTIMSRCQRFDFRRVSQADIMLKLGRICKSEGIKIKTEALRLVARSAAGSLRDAENLLEQLFTFYGANIGLSQVQAILGITGDKRVKELVGCIVGNDIPAGMTIINTVSGDGLDLKQFNRELVAYLRCLLLIKNGCDKNLDLTTEETSELKELSATTSMEHILKSVKLFGRLELKANDYSTLSLELALVDSITSPENEKATAVEAAATTIVKPVTAIPNTSGKAVPVKPPAAKAEPVKAVVKENIAPPPPQEVPEIKAEKSDSPSSKEEVVKTTPPEVDGQLKNLQSNWKQVIEQAPESVKRTAAVAILRSAGVQPVAIDGDTVILTFKYSYHKEKIDEAENKKITADIISNFLGRRCQVRCIFEQEENYLVREAQRMGAQITDVEEK
ncbi:DNA polymerase III subunit gamma/tau [Chloroflexota bacterium]